MILYRKDAKDAKKNRIKINGKTLCDLCAFAVKNIIS
jgi:hypothetical protein